LLAWLSVKKATRAELGHTQNSQKATALRNIEKESGATPLPFSFPAFNWSVPLRRGENCHHTDGLTLSLRLGYPETLAQSCVCASAGIIKLDAVPGVPQASGDGISGLPAHSTRSSLPGVLTAPDFWNADGSAHRFVRKPPGLDWIPVGFRWDCCGLPPYRGRRVNEIEWKRVQKDVDLHAELA
jgi:hypothetical protein